MPRLTGNTGKPLLIKLDLPFIEGKMRFTMVTLKILICSIVSKARNARVSFTKKPIMKTISSQSKIKKI